MLSSQALCHSVQLYCPVDQCIALSIELSGDVDVLPECKAGTSHASNWPGVCASACGSLLEKKSMRAQREHLWGQVGVCQLDTLPCSVLWSSFVNASHKCSLHPLPTQPTLNNHYPAETSMNLKRSWGNDNKWQLEGSWRDDWKWMSWIRYMPQEVAASRVTARIVQHRGTAHITTSDVCTVDIVGGQIIGMDSWRIGWDRNGQRWWHVSVARRTVKEKQRKWGTRQISEHSAVVYLSIEEKDKLWWVTMMGSTA